MKQSSNKAMTSTRAKVWTLQVIPSSAKVQTSWIWDCRRLTQRIKSGRSSALLPELKGLRVSPTALRLGMVLQKLQWYEWSIQKHTATILKILSLKIPKFLSRKIFLWLDQLKMFHWHDQQNLSHSNEQQNLIHSHDQRNLSHSHDQQSLSHSHYQRNLSHSHYRRNFQRMKNSMYQMTRTQNHHCQAHHQRKINVIRRKIVRTHKKDNSSDPSSSKHSDW